MPCKTTLVHLRTYTNQTLSVPSAQVRTSQSIAPATQFYASAWKQPIMKVPAYCKCHAKRAVFTCAPKKLDTFSSFRPGQTVTKYCACHTILRVSLKVANHESPTYGKCHAKRAVFACAPKKLDTFSSFGPGQTVTKYCACHAKQRVHLRSLAHLKSGHLRT